MWVNFGKIGTQPHFGNILLVDSNTIFVDFKVAETFGKAVKSMKTLIIEMKDIRKGEEDNSGKPEGYAFGIDRSTI
jgi:hypothetical protein